MTKTVDQWAAEACGVEFPDYLDDGWCIYEDTVILWTIKDPRCREIVREHFGINTYFSRFLDKCRWYCWQVDHGSTRTYDKIKEAELDCIESIFEAQK